MTHECKCREHRCKNLAACPDGENCTLRRCPLDRCDDCMADPDCTGESLCEGDCGYHASH